MGNAEQNVMTSDKLFNSIFIYIYQHLQCAFSTGYKAQK